MFEVNFSWHNKILGAQKIGGTAPECLLRGYGPARQQPSYEVTQWLCTILQKCMCPL